MSNLTISSPTDPAELEAERIAAEVMRMPDPAPAAVVHRKCAACDDEEKVYRSATGEGPGAAPPIVNQVLSQSGRPLSSATRSFFEPRLGADLSSVRVHTDSQAAESADAVQAKAYAVGNSIAFADGQYAPHSESGKGLLAHELAHVVQQGRRQLRRDPNSEGEYAPAIRPPTFDPESINVGEMTNGTFIAESNRVEDWFRANSISASPDFPAYTRLRERLNTERALRIMAGHRWLSEKHQSLPTMLCQLVPGEAGRTNIVSVSLELALGAPQQSLASPIVTTSQLNAHLIGRGITQIDEQTYQRSFAQAAPNKLFKPPMTPGRAMPYGTRAEPWVARLFFPDSTLLPPRYAAYDIVEGGNRDFEITHERVRGAQGKQAVVNETIVDGQWGSIKTVLDPSNETPAHMKKVINDALSDMANKRGRLRYPDPVADKTYHRIEAVTPGEVKKATIVILVSEESFPKLPELNQAAREHLSSVDIKSKYGPNGLPADIDVVVKSWNSKNARPVPLGPGASMGVGALGGGLIAVTVAGGLMIFDAKDHPASAVELAKQGGTGVLAGASQAGIEQAVIKGAGRFMPGVGSNLLGKIGQGIGAGVVSGALEGYNMTQEPFEHSAAEVGVRTTRAAALGVISTEVGIAAGAGAVAVIFGSAATGAGAGAAAGTVVPVAGNAAGAVVGFIIGLAVGAGTYYLLDKLPGGRENWHPNRQ